MRFYRQLAALGALTLLLVAAPALAQGPVFVVLLVHRATNVCDTDATSTLAVSALPASNRYQDVLDSQVKPDPAAEYLDSEQQRVVSVALGPIPAGQTRAVRALAWVRTKPVNARLVRPAKPVDPLPESAEESFLDDGPLLQLEKVRPFATRAIGDKERDVDKARALYEFMTNHCRYDIDEHVDSAPAVLDRKPASCSELAITYVALCRSVGIPARTVLAAVNRGGTSPSIDWRAHRWAEFFAEGIGWVPVDPTNKINHPSKRFFGHQQGKYLTFLDDGATPENGPDLGARPFLLYREPGNVRCELLATAAWRVSTNRADEADFFNKACETLADPDPLVRRLALQQWERDRAALRVPFMLELLFDADAGVRSEAAAAIGRAGDVSVMLALMDRAGDEKDDAVRRAILDAARQLLAVENEEQRAWAVGELAKSRTPDAVELLTDIWKDPGREVRKTAAQLLYKLGDKPPVHANYRELARDQDEFIRVLAALRWARVGSHEALTRLVDLLASRNSWDREQAVAELQKRTGDNFGYDPGSRPDGRRNRDAIRQFETWLDDHADAR